MPKRFASPAARPSSSGKRLKRSKSPLPQLSRLPLSATSFNSLHCLGGPRQIVPCARAVQLPHSRRRHSECGVDSRLLELLLE
eukprot:2412256-Pleurochrysis_carterae.AAC.2